MYASEPAPDSLPAALLASSDALGWTGVSAHRYRETPLVDAFARRAEPDLLLVLVTSGVYAIESLGGSAPVRAVYRPGSIGITAPGRSTVLRWQSLTRDPMESLHIRVSVNLLDRVARELDTPLRHEGMDTLVAEDRLLVSAAQQVAWALDAKAPGPVAESAAHLLAAHVVGQRAASQAGADLTGSTLRAVVGYLHDRLAEEITLDDLSGVANLSKFHLLRCFRQSTGQTPAQFLTELRMNRGALLLRTTDRPIATVSDQCGYRNSSHFAAAFRRHHGVAPAEYRQHVRSDRQQAPGAQRRVEATGSQS